MKTLKNLLFSFIYIYIFFTALLPYNFKIPGVPILLSANFILLLIILLYIAIILKDKAEFSVNIKNFSKDFLGLGLICFLGIMLISTTYAAVKTIALSESLRLLSYIIIYFIIKYETGNEKYTKGIFHSYIITLAAANIFGLIQALTGLGSERKFIVGSIDRISITFGNPNSFAAFLIIGVFPVLMLMIKEKRVKQKLSYGLLFISMMINIYFTQSRNSWIALVLGCILLSVIYNWRFLIGILSLGALVQMIPQISNRVNHLTNDLSNQNRINSWKVAIKMIKDHPFMGVGNGNYEKLYGSYVKKYPELAYSTFTEWPTHNSYLKVESELGILGGIIFLSVLSGSVYKVRKVIMNIKEEFYNAFYIGFFASVFAFFFMNFSDNLFFTPKVVSYFWIFIALADSLLLQNK